MADSDLRAKSLTYGPYLSVAVAFLFMLWVRLRPSDRVIKDTAVVFSGNDPWYHARVVQYTVRFFPSTPTFDPWSYFPYGTGRHSGFGGLFDQLIALAALVTGFGSPSTHHIEVVTAYAPAVFGALTVVPVYLVMRRLFDDRWLALLSVGLLALVNGQFLTRTVIGVSDHQSAEAFFGTLALFGFIYAFEKAYLENPTYADIQDRNWRVLRRPAIAGVIGGVFIASYLMMWGPGVFLVFTIGIFVVLQHVRDYLNGRSTEFLTFAVVSSFTVAAVLTLLYAKSYELSATAFSLLQPLVLLGVAAGSLVLWSVARRFRETEYESSYYPVAVGLLILGVLALVSVVQPRLFSLLESLIIRIYSFGLLTSQTALTVQEIAPATPDDAWRSFTVLFPIAILGLALLIYRVIQENRPVELLVVLWSLTIASAYFTMIRFGYYMGVTVAMLAGYAIYWTIKTADLDAVRDLSDLETYQILVLLIIVVAILPGNVIAMGGTSSPVWDTADRFGGSSDAWHSELRWVKNNTQEIPLAYYDNYQEPDDGDFVYPEGAYGIMSWWDYGHWITYTGHRIPNANPFQQGPRPSSAFLLAENETRANLILEALSVAESPNDVPSMSVDELQEIVEPQSGQQAGEDTRYVMIDDQMAAGKFSAIATWTGPGPGRYFSRQQFQVGNSEAQLTGVNDRYHDTMLAKLYLRDANGLSHYRLVHETGQSAIVSVAQQTPQGFQSTSFINQRLTSQVFAAVQQRQDLAFYDVKQPATVKTFERVPGATLTGQVETENATTVFATVQLQTNRNRNFTYVQTVETDANGNFEMTVPYATTNTVDPAEGGTDSGVVALGKYELFAGNPFQPSATGNTTVPEPAIYDGETITVEMNTVERPSGNETSNGNTTEEGNSSASNESSLILPSSTQPSTTLSSPGTSSMSKVGSILAEPRWAADV